MPAPAPLLSRGAAAQSGGAATWLAPDGQAQTWAAEGGLRQGARVPSRGSYLRRRPWAPALWPGRPGSAACP